MGKITVTSPRLGTGRRPSLRAVAPHRFRMIFLFCIGCGIFLFIQHSLTNWHVARQAFVEEFPKKIWQSWKVDALRFEQRDTERALSWTTRNPSHRYEVLTDESAITYVKQHFGPSGFNRPDIVSTYMSLNARIIQADLLRYLIMYVEGGLWADIDVEALRPINHFIPKRYLERDISMIVGIETDEPDFKDHPVLGSKAQSFCQWTFVCKPRMPVMMRLINNILAWLNELAEQQNRPISALELDFDEVLSGTGPSAFTVAILAEMSETVGRTVTWSDFHDLDESKVVGGVLVLPSEAFAAGTGHSDSGNHGGRAALVKHHFHASSWPTNHPRYKHPIFGEIEKCNWDPECVKLWDTNTAFFAALPEEEQLKMIALKDLDDHKPATGAKSNLALDPEIGPPAGLPPSDPLADISEEKLKAITQTPTDNSDESEDSS